MTQPVTDKTQKPASRPATDMAASLVTEAAFRWTDQTCGRKSLQGIVKLDRQGQMIAMVEACRKEQGKGWHGYGRFSRGSAVFTWTFYYREAAITYCLEDDND